MAAARTRPGTAKSAGKAEPKSRAKAETAHKRSDDQQQEVLDSGGWPRNPDGSPMTRIEIAAAELIPTGQFANVSVGPAKIVHFINANDPEPISDAQKENIARGLNELAEVVEADVIAVQRNLVHESLQEQIASNGN
jgi:hypothetical protein